MGRLRECNCGPPQKQGVCHIVALPFTLKKYLKAKEELWKLKIFHHAKSIPNLQKNPLKETKSFQDIVTLQLISNFNTSQNHL